MEKGIKNTYRALRDMGFSHYTAVKLNNGKAKGIDTRGTERLCRAINCSPNDFYAFYEDEGNPLSPSHPLQKLKRPRSLVNVVDQLKRLQPDELQQMYNLAQKLETERNSGKD